MLTDKYVTRAQLQEPFNWNPISRLRCAIQGKVASQDSRHVIIESPTVRFTEHTENQKAEKECVSSWIQFDICPLQNPSKPQMATTKAGIFGGPFSSGTSS